MVRRIATTGVLAVLVVLGVAACTPSDLELEERTTKSAFHALTGSPASAKPTCALEHTQTVGSDQVFEGSCSVHGRSFNLNASYRVNPSYETAFVSASHKLRPGTYRVHTCSWENKGRGWYLISPCRTADVPGAY